MSASRAKSVPRGNLVKVEHYVAAEGRWKDVPITRWDAVKQALRRLLGLGKPGGLK